MTKSDLVDYIAEQNDITKTQAGDIVDSTFDYIIEQVASGNDVRIAGFGVFEQKQRTARKGRNPATGESMLIPSATLPKFRAYTGFKESVNQ